MTSGEGGRVPRARGTVGRGSARAVARDFALPFGDVTRHGSGGASPYRASRVLSPLTLALTLFSLKRADADFTQFRLNSFLFLRIRGHLERLLQLRRAGSPVTLSRNYFASARQGGHIL